MAKKVTKSTTKARKTAAKAKPNVAAKTKTVRTLKPPVGHSTLGRDRIRAAVAKVSKEAA
jgi:hypothetical protein